ncbi:hypothetical protein P168DRAFT_327728 [Aspergillus campestris IBT 28561]|uniref:Uncharacterized protein n=1 Tax=Aspergillus campestris (strain IBT 28561) TaxID=1392248 RepID=A0A2I1D1B6_ASPC2|nr:uncharacterized protein P168DRAFT_327728 [Aspergillus campestris IBT 28561]PKY03671.1 hypothetical protein P168DRAFT_327728 [Aspergillus campestris IBT 28561]
MGAESLTTALNPRPNEHYYPETHQKRPACGSPFRRMTTTPPPPPPPPTPPTDNESKNKPTSGETWSIKRLLGRHVSRRLPLSFSSSRREID